MKKTDWCFLIHLSDGMWEDHTKLRKNSRLEPKSTKLITEKEVWDEVTEYAAKSGCTSILIDLGDAVQYKSHPEIAIEGAWTVEYLKEELDRLRGLGLTPYPKLNFSTGHDTWLGVYHRMVSTPEYYKVCKDLIDEVIDIFDQPELFHLGMDEEDSKNQVYRDFVSYRQYDLLWHDMRFFCDCVREKGVRPWIWSDHFWTSPDEFVENIGKDVLVSPWKYLHFYFENPEDKPTDPWETARFESYIKLPELGYEIMPCFSNCHITTNTDEVVQYTKENSREDKVRGFVVAPWFMTTTRSKFRILEGLQFAKLAKEKYGY